MEKNALKRLNRRELLELLLEVTKENEELRIKVDNLENQVKKQTIIISEKNSVAEIGIKITGVFEVIEQATKKYLEKKDMVDNEESMLVNEEKMLNN